MKPTGDPETVLTRYREGPALLERTLAGLTAAELDAPPRQGGWTIRQIVHHVADGDDLWKVGLKAALGEARHAQVVMGLGQIRPQGDGPGQVGRGPGLGLLALPGHPLLVVVEVGGQADQAGLEGLVGLGGGGGLGTVVAVMQRVTG